MAGRGDSLSRATELMNRLTIASKTLDEIEIKATATRTDLSGVYLALSQIAALTARMGLGEEAREWIRTLRLIISVATMAFFAVSAIHPGAGLAGAALTTPTAGGLARGLASIVGGITTNVSIEANRRT